MMANDALSESPVGTIHLTAGKLGVGKISSTSTTGTSNM